MNPLIFQPILKRIRWGGRRLATDLKKELGSEIDYAESWEISDHGDDQSVVLEGDYSGWTLQRLVAEKNSELFGQQTAHEQFPLLIKYLDAQDRLSLQVHPNDQQVKKFDVTENGKTEAWIILDALPNSLLYTGLKDNVSHTILNDALAAGMVEDCLHSYAVHAGDVIFVPAGTVHAIDEGVLLAEIQQSSDITFRLHDWGRLNANGNPRELHIENGLACINFEQGPVHPVQPIILKEGSHQLEELIRCEQFVIQRHQTTIPFTISTENRFRILMTLSGTATLQVDDENSLLTTGKTILIPASCADVTITPQSEVLLIETFLP